MDLAQTKSEAKMEFVGIISELMPGGNASHLEVIKFPMIKNLVVEWGKKTMLKAIFLLVRDFCNSINVVRNMNEDQMIEAAAMLIDECDNFRLEDYAMMFSIGKKGILVKIFDRIDISVITQMLDEYWKRRNIAVIKLEERERQTLDGLGPSARLLDNVHPLDTKIAESVNSLASAFGDLKNKLMEWREENKQ